MTDRPAEPKAKPTTDLKPHRPPVSDAKRAANRANAKKSTGPRTEAGKARSRLNGLVHGLRAETPVLPGESDEALARRVAGFVAETRSSGEVERALAEDAALASWRMRRCLRVEAARVSKLMTDAAEAEDHARALEVDALTDRLAADPRRVARELRRTAGGCRWVLGRFRWLREALESRGWWEPSERDLALNLMGKSAHDAHRDTIAYDLCHAFLCAGTEGKVDAPSVESLLGGPPPGMDPREFGRRAEALAQSVSRSDPARAKADLAALLQREIDRLAGRERRLRAREAADRARAADRLGCDTSRDGQTLLRYEETHRRAFHNALRDLRAEQDRRAEDPAMPPEPPEPPARRKPAAAAVVPEDRTSEPSPDAAVADAPVTAADLAAAEAEDDAADPAPEVTAPTEPTGPRSSGKSPVPKTTSGERFAAPSFRGGGTGRATPALDPVAALPESMRKFYRPGDPIPSAEKIAWWEEQMRIQELIGPFEP